ncbi:hypothetical protein LRS11_07110 [Pseudomonas sp. J452]|uniref:hypothetical protein n=1 Tax=Pseudomonas sp. J452 TaxID=2898441 RepID=UPI0021AD88FD|nr:hypothetical protein [Pseudomonas sp. J452]UUY09796.1 hypothetical protein LRS11_07110 [Pseudomonas sp. J452]
MQQRVNTPQHRPDSRELQPTWRRAEFGTQIVVETVEYGARLSSIGRVVIAS